MSRFNQKQTNKTINLAGGQAIKHNPEMELIVSVLSTFLKDEFYESGDERVERIKGLIKLNKPEFVAKLAVMARTQFYLRSVSHLLVAELSRIHRGDNLVSRTLVKIAERPDDLVEIVAYLGHPIPKQIKVGIALALRNFNRYQLAKYKLETKKIKLVDLFNLVHPKPATEEQKNDWKDLMEGNLKNEETWEARLSSGEDKAKVWRDLVSENKIGYMALLRNLRNIDEQADEETKQKACRTIASKERVKVSKQLPFRFYSAYEQVSNQDMLQAISQALDYSVENVPKFDGETLIGIDSSGSMEGDPIKKASIFAAALLKTNNADVVLYDTSLKELRFLRQEPVLSLSQKIQREAMGGGTETSLVFRHAIQKNKKYDRIIILSDNESWSESYYSGQGVNYFYKEYQKINDCFVYAIDIQGYGTKDVSGEKVFHLAGWSEKIFDFVEWIEKQNQLVEFVEKTEI